MSTLKYILRDEIGRIDRGDICEDQLRITVNGSQRLSFNLHEDDALGIDRLGDTLRIDLANGRKLAIDGFFGDDGRMARLYFSTDGMLHEIRIETHADGSVDAHRGPTARAGASSLSDTLMHKERAILSAPEPSPPLTEPKAFVSVKGGAPIVITGQAELGHSMRVTLDDLEADLMMLDEGKWEARFAFSDIKTGRYAAKMIAASTDAAGAIHSAIQPVTVVRDDDHCALYLDGDATVHTEQPTEPLATTPPAEPERGIEFAGQAEAGSTVTLQFAGQDFAADIDASGNWVGTIPGSAITSGSYSADVAIVAIDPQGRRAQLIQTLEIDTNAPDGPLVMGQDVAA